MLRVKAEIHGFNVDFKVFKKKGIAFQYVHMILSVLCSGVARTELFLRTPRKNLENFSQVIDFESFRTRMTTTKIFQHQVAFISSHIVFNKTL